MKLSRLVVAMLCLGPAAQAAEAAAPSSPTGVDETTSYRLRYGLFGKVAELSIRYQADTRSTQPSPKPFRATGAGGGAILGFGETVRRYESEFDQARRVALRWTSSRQEDGTTTTHTAEQAKPGTITLREHRDGKDDSNQSFDRPGAVLDPLSFLLRLRTSLPHEATSYEVLDGKALWRVDIASALADGGSPSLIRVEGKLEPIDWGGRKDPLRSSQAFTLFLSNDRFHTPTHAVFPMGIGQVEADLVSIQRWDIEGYRRTMHQLLRLIHSKQGRTN